MQVKSLYPYIVVADVEESIKFYKDTLGFAIKHDAVTEFCARLIVVENEAGNELEIIGESNNDAFPLKAGTFGMRMNVDDIESAVGELKAKGYELIGSIIDSPAARGQVVKDPSGFSITILQHIR